MSSQRNRRATGDAPLLEVGRIGSAAKPGYKGPPVGALPPSREGMVVVSCLDLREPPDREHMLMRTVVDFFSRNQPDAFEQLVGEVVAEIELGQSVHVCCAFGRVRSQAVARVAAEQLKRRKIAFVGPKLLRPIKRKK